MKIGQKHVKKHKIKSLWFKINKSKIHFFFLKPLIKYLVTVISLHKVGEEES